MKNFKTFIIVLSMLSFKLSLAQHFEYGYDDVGNRVHREYSALRMANPNQLINEPEVIKENFGVKAYPNPTCDKVTIDLENFDQLKRACVEVYNFTGTLIFKKQILASSIILDLATEANGIYLVNIISDKQLLQMKVIKTNCNGVENVKPTLIIKPGTKQHFGG